MEPEVRPIVVIQRLDEGRTHMGSFRCTVPGCSWRLEGSVRAACNHAQRVHHAAYTTERVVPLYKPSEEEKKRKAAERTRRWEEKKKVRQVVCWSLRGRDAEAGHVSWRETGNTFL
jgi:hypothetical protein